MPAASRISVSADRAKTKNNAIGNRMVIVFVFLQGISSISEGTRKRQRESLENAIMRSVTHCYAVEGAYPATPNDSLTHCTKYWT